MNVDLAFEAKWPSIPWRTPIGVNNRYGCRFCIGKCAFKGSEIATCSFIFDTEQECRDHINREHPISESNHEKLAAESPYRRTGR